MFSADLAPVSPWVSGPGGAGARDSRRGQAAGARDSSRAARVGRPVPAKAPAPRGLPAKPALGFPRRPPCPVRPGKGGGVLCPGRPRLWEVGFPPRPRLPPSADPLPGSPHLPLGHPVPLGPPPRNSSLPRASGLLGSVGFQRPGSPPPGSTLLLRPPPHSPLPWRTRPPVLQARSPIPTKGGGCAASPSPFIFSA